MAFLPMEISIAMYSRHRDIIVLVSKYRRRVVTELPKKAPSFQGGDEFGAARAERRHYE